ncbi:MAG: TrbC/VirB2 family protein [Bdellovibrionota bacterium]
MKNLKNIQVFTKSIFVLSTLSPLMAMASVESTLMNIQGKLINVILPLAGIIGLAFAGLSFVAGHENARQRLWFGIIGAVVGFGAPSIIAFLRGIVN